MQGSRESLRDFITAHAAVPDAVPAVMRNLEPLYGQAESGCYRLAAGNDIGLEEIADTISCATGRQARTVALTLISRIGHITAADEAALWRQLSSDRGDTLGDCLREEHRTALQDRLDRPERRGHVRLQQLLWERIDADLCRRLDEAVYEAIGGSAPRPVLQAVSDSLRTTVFYFTGFAMAGDGRRMLQMTGLVRLITMVIPLHASQRDPRRWQTLAH